MNRPFLMLLIGSVTAITITSFIAGYYYVQYRHLIALIERYEAVTMRVNICINYGNGTVIWYNKTIVHLGCNLLEATKLIAKVNATYWPAYQAWFVDAINDVWNKPPYYWMWLYWDENKNAWEYGPVGADRYVLKPDEIVMWRYG